MKARVVPSFKVTCRLDPTVVVAMAAGLARLGAAMDVNTADEKGAADCAAVVALVAVVAEVAQPPTNALTDMAPKGSMGALARNLSA